MVEFGLVFPLFVLLLAGMLDFGLGLYNYMSVINAAGAGARYGATACAVVACTASVQQQAVSAAAAGGVTVALADTTVTCTNKAGTTVDCTNATTPASTRAGGYVKVTVAYKYHMIWPLTFGTQIGETSTVTMRIEDQT
jgi:Flp pilus assembly protein TadG